MDDSTLPDAGADADDEVRETRQAQAVVARLRFRAETVAAMTLALLAVFYTLYFAAGIILPLVLALVLNLLLSPAMRLLTRRLRVPRLLAALALIVVLFSVVGAIGAAISLPASGWLQRAPQGLPKLEQKLSAVRGPITAFEGGLQRLQGVMQQSGGGGGGEHTVAVQSGGMGEVSGAILSGTRAFVGQAFTVVLVLFFLLSSGDSLLHRFVEVLPSFGDKRRAVEIAREVEENISRYLATISMMNLLVGVLNGLQVWLLGMPDPLLWGVLAFLLNYIPILGPLTGVCIFFFVGLFTFSTVWWALVPSAIYLCIHVMEGETITPMLLARRFTLNPLLVIVSLMFWDWIWGIPGAFLSVPLLAVFKILCDHVEVLTPVGHMLGASHAKPGQKG